MKHLWKPFQGLRWKLTLSYTLVTVATWLVIEIIFIGGLSFMLLYSDVIPGAMVYAMDTFIVPQVAEYLDQSEPDVESMQQWMESSFAEGITFESPENPSLSFHLGDLDRNAYISILDQDLIQLMGFPPSGELNVSPQDQGIPDLLRAARMGEKSPEVISRISGGFLTTAVPVFNGKGEVLGVILMVITYPPPGSFVQALLLIGISIILFTLATGLVGTVFGYFTARGLTGRLGRISSAANSWSGGNFSAFILDRSDDELGQLSQQLNRMAEQLQQLLKTKEDLATLEERNRLARDLHDSVKQQVFATTMQIGAARAMLGQDADKTEQHLDQAEALSRQAQSELGALIRELRPVTLSEAGFIPSLREYANDWAKHSAVEVELTVSETPEMDKQVEQALFRVTQEALANVSRHSQATNVKIGLSGINSEIVLSISDDGIGFDMPEVSDRGMGLANMRERMRSVGGQLEIDSQPGGGTRITAKCEGE